VGLRTSLDRCGKSRPHWDFFLSLFTLQQYIVIGNAISLLVWSLLVCALCVSVVSLFYLSTTEMSYKLYSFTPIANVGGGGGRSAFSFEGRLPVRCLSAEVGGLAV
jgi:hypothetical protein